MNRLILDLINKEVERQDSLWKERNNNTQLKWNCILTEEAGEVSEVVNDIDNEGMDEENLSELETELIHVSAVCVSWLRALQVRNQLDF